MSYKCKRCEKSDFKLYPPISDLAAYVRCTHCGEEVSQFERVDFEFQDMPEDMVPEINFEGSNTLWSWSCGGAPHSDNEFSIKYLAGKDGWGPECRFKLPDAISRMLIRQYERGRDDARSAMRRSLGI